MPLAIVAALALVLAAALVSLAQPFTGKELLPLVGGTPAVWTTCLVTFQTLLLLGYYYAHRVSQLPGRLQVAVHALACVVAVGAGAWLRGRADSAWIPTDAANPVGHLVAFLVARMGLPFLVLSATAPLVSGWLARATRTAVRHPYRLYAASNVGSLVGLVAYPFVVEPRLSLADQETLLGGGFVAAVGLVVAVGVLARPGRAGRAVASPRDDRLTWLALSALAASLLASGSAHLSTDIAPVPLVWVLPLALYLSSFVVTFSAWGDRAARLAGRLLATGLVFLTIALATRAAEPLLLVAGLHLGVLTLAWLVCHGELARRRPPPAELTHFYLTIAIGGALGGFFNAVVAPVVFARLGPVEYPLGVALVALVRPLAMTWAFTRRDAFTVAGYVLLCVVLIVGVGSVWPTELGDDAGRNLLNRALRAGLLFGVPAAVAFALVARPVRYSLCLAALLGLSQLDAGPHGYLLKIRRNFFGTLRVTASPDGEFIRLVHGTTQHGQERRTEPGRPTPLMYYHPTGPVGRLLTGLPDAPRRVAAVGLGTGALACYARPGESWAFYEVDPAVVELSRDPDHFRALSSAPEPVAVVLGDARRTLAAVPDHSIDVLILDAFNSDAVPTHLLTREAVALYHQKLTPTGIIAAHLSNVYLDLVPTFAAAVAERGEGYTILTDDDSPTESQRLAGKTRSLWAVATRQPDDLPAAVRRWRRVPPPTAGAWRDDFANLLSAWRKAE